MANIDTHAPGAFCWIELGTSDQDAAKHFYSTLFGWTVIDHPMGPSGVYTMFQLNGRDSGAAYGFNQEQRTRGFPPHWMIYVAVESADAAATRAGELGATVLAPPFDVFDLGRMSVMKDPAGAVFSIWQANRHKGLLIAGDDNAFCWADLNTPDRETARQFYSGLFGWEIDSGAKDASEYWHISNGKSAIGGIPPAHGGGHAPPHWLIYFAVADVDATAEKARSMGAKLHVEPMTIEHVGRMAVLADPQGAVFALFKAAPRS